MIEKQKQTINIKALAIQIAIPLCVGAVSGFLSMGGMETYQNLRKSALAPPGLVFPLVWTVLYILMGISAYLISESRLSVKKQEHHRQRGLALYAIQLGINFFWPIIFFRSQSYLFAFWWLVALTIFVIWMTAEFWQVEQSAAYLQIPYILWLIFAGYLNLTVFLMNR